MFLSFWKPFAKKGLSDMSNFKSLPLAVLLEVTHRCPLKCVYCSNPVQLMDSKSELNTPTWFAILDEAAKIGVLQVHFSGGEPMARNDIFDLVEHATKLGLYSNLITSGVLMNAEKLDKFKSIGLSHIQLSFQDLDESGAEWASGYSGGVEKKRDVARAIIAAGIALTLNFVITRQNHSRIDDMLSYALSLGVNRVEIANTQYYGWGLLNRKFLLPTQEQLNDMTQKIQAWRERCRGRMVIDYVVPDYYASKPKACMNGWGQRFINVMPDGSILPCHAAQTIPHLNFPKFPESSLLDAWLNSEAFSIYRGSEWLPEPCQSCDRKEIDWGGCRCQALALAGRADTLDPVCHKSSEHDFVLDLAKKDSAEVSSQDQLQYRKIYD